MNATIFIIFLCFSLLQSSTIIEKLCKTNSLPQNRKFACGLYHEIQMSNDIEAEYLQYFLSIMDSNKDCKEEIQNRQNL